MFMVLIDGQDLQGKTTTSYFLLLINIVFVIRIMFARKHSSFNSFGMVEELNILVTQAVC